MAITQGTEGSALSAKPWLSITDAAQYTGLCERSIRRLLDSEKVVARRPLRGRVLINREELDSYILGCTR